MDPSNTEEDGVGAVPGSGESDKQEMVKEEPMVIAPDYGSEDDKQEEAPSSIEQ